ncbi:Lymphocyte activation gene 3 protein [Cricetulus griseus]|uniref:Lymphocyte activation gene 3 protein n=1 Tax=Cricetulus griseus TaxID=10029 RepID=G3GUN8_CRIGR|nr:Lymphocyte activation gene 3 protein [Cricetulus griseus]
MPSPGSPAPRRYTVLSMAPGGLRSGRLPLHPRVQLEERGLQRGDFSLWLRPALRADAGEYHAAVRFPDRTLSCHLRLRIGQASSSRPDRPVSVHWFQGQSRVPVQKSPHHYLAEGFLFLPQVSPLDSGTWGCVLTYRDGFNVSMTYNLKVLGLEPLAPLTVYAAAGSRVELPCHLPPGVGTSSSLIAKWTPPGGGPKHLVTGKNGSFTLQLEAVSLAQAGTYTCSIHLQGQQLSAIVTLAVITGARSARRISGDLKGGHLFLLLILGTFSLFLLVTGIFGFHLWRRQWLWRRFSALENRIHPPPAPSKTEELERELETEMEQEPEPEPEPEREQEPQLEPEPRQL